MIAANTGMPPGPSSRSSSGISRSAPSPTSRCCGVEKGQFGFADQHGARLKGTERLRCELTLRDGKVVYDLNDMTGVDWDKLPPDYRGHGDPRWDGISKEGAGGVAVVAVDAARVADVARAADVARGSSKRFSSEDTR